MDNERIIKKFGNNLKALRLQKGWTQTKLGVEAGMEPQHIGKLERGLHEAGIVTAVMLAQALECEIQELISK